MKSKSLPKRKRGIIEQNPQAAYPLPLADYQAQLYQAHALPVARLLLRLCPDLLEIEEVPAYKAA